MLATVLAAAGQGYPSGRGGLIAPLAPESEAARVPRPLRLAATSVVVVLGTEAFVLPLGVPLAFLLFRTDLWGRRVGIAMAALLAFVPLPLVATAWLGALGNAGDADSVAWGSILDWTLGRSVHPGDGGHALDRPSGRGRAPLGRTRAGRSSAARPASMASRGTGHAPGGVRPPWPARHSRWP